MKSQDAHAAPMPLLKEAQQAALGAYAPYSRFAVGAAVETDEGEYFSGANMENASYGLTICAEVGALQAASLREKLDKIVRIAVVGGQVVPANTNQGPAVAVTPCGRCRQLISESAQLSKHDLEVWCADLSLSTITHYKISELIPDSFGPANLGMGNDWNDLMQALRKRLGYPEK